MFAKLKAKWLYFWHNHVQKTTGWFMTTFLGLDLTGYAEPIKGLIGPTKYYGLVMTAAVLNTARAHTAKPSTLPPAV